MLVSHQINLMLLSSFLILNSIVSLFTVNQAMEMDDYGSGSILYNSFERSSYAFDIYSLRLSDSTSEHRLTDGESINFNGQFLSSSSLSKIHLLPNNSHPSVNLVYVTERHGSSSIYLDALYFTCSCREGSRSTLGIYGKSDRLQFPLVNDEKFNGGVSMKDKPSLVGDSLVYASTHEDPGKPRVSWTAVYKTQLITGSTVRLTPRGVADFSPAVSPSGTWTAVASSGEKGWDGEVRELATDIYIFLTSDGSKRVKVIEHGGWPSWANDSTLYFHRQSDGGWWSVFRAVLKVENGEFAGGSTVVERVTPPGMHAFTPAASVADKSFIAVATRRSNSRFRHIELFNVTSSKFVELTRPISPNAHHYNPFISPDSASVGYHKCRGNAGDGNKINELLLESLRSPLPNVSILRIDGSFPSFSPNGGRIAYANPPGIYVMNSDGSGARVVINQNAFSTAWDWKRKGVVYTSIGPIFAGTSAKVDIVSINVDDEHLSYTKLTTNGENNAFPSPSPDGKWVVFRSGRSGYKNLYIMDAISGESGGLYRLTEGPWSDTMCNWSPDGEWILFASDMENPGSDSFELFKIHPNGTGLQKLVQSGSGGRTNHPWYSPDGKHIVFTSDYAGVSAEPIANPFHFQPYGDIFVMKSDGSSIQRITHSAYEDGTPTWGPRFMKADNVAPSSGGSPCSFEDCRWLNISPRQGFSTTLRRQCGV